MGHESGSRGERGRATGPTRTATTPCQGVLQASASTRSNQPHTLSTPEKRATQHRTNTPHDTHSRLGCRLGQHTPPPPPSRPCAPAAAVMRYAQQLLLRPAHLCGSANLTISGRVAPDRSETAPLSCCTAASAPAAAATGATCWHAGPGEHTLALCGAGLCWPRPRARTPAPACAHLWNSTIAQPLDLPLSLWVSSTQLLMGPYTWKRATTSSRVAAEEKGREGEGDRGDLTREGGHSCSGGCRNGDVTAAAAGATQQQPGSPGRVCCCCCWSRAAAPLTFKPEAPNE